jgi:hypothetical protein
MVRFVIKVLCGLLMIIVLGAMIAYQRKDIIKLQKDAESARAQERIRSEVSPDPVPFSELANQNAQSVGVQTAPSADLLRLRSEVAQAREIRIQVEELQRTNEILRAEVRQAVGPTANESYAMTGLDTNGLPDIELGATKEEVSAELHRVNASILTNDKNNFHVQVYSAMTKGGNVAEATIEIYLSFDDDGKLAGRRDEVHFPR